MKKSLIILSVMSLVCCLEAGTNRDRFYQPVMTSRKNRQFERQVAGDVSWRVDQRTRWVQRS